ncbi:hypothetical protein TgHK011_001024 [Trichoderma gracile]|nr:hypothetical protein TgHK011_001024 [Trichoderma gracile]
MLLPRSIKIPDLLLLPTIRQVHSILFFPPHHLQASPSSPLPPEPLETFLFPSPPPSIKHKESSSSGRLLVAVRCLPRLSLRVCISQKHPSLFDSSIVTMKSVVIALCTLVAATAAQGSANLAACGQTCAANMLSADKADELGCKQNDLRCLCANKNFLYGLRDCSAAICSAEDARKVVEYGISVCAGAGVAIQTSSGGASGGASRTASASGSATDSVSTLVTATGSGAITETLLTTLTSDGTTVTTGIATATGNASNGVVSTFTTAITESDGSVHTSTGQTTLSGTISVTLTGSVPTATGTESAVLTTVTSGSSAIVKTLTTTSETATVTESATQTESTSAEATETETATETASSSAASTSSTGAGVPQKTAGPVGIIAAAGVALLML